MEITFEIHGAAYLTEVSQITSKQLVQIIFGAEKITISPDCLIEVKREFRCRAPQLTYACLASLGESLWNYTNAISYYAFILCTRADYTRSELESKYGDMSGHDAYHTLKKLITELGNE